jgi:hypothetical protein
MEEAEIEVKNPIRGIFTGCCAWAKETVVKKIVASCQRRNFIFAFLHFYFCFT